MRNFRVIAAALLVLAVTANPLLASRRSIPAFARKYGISCSVCHAPVPRLTEAGAKFAANGFEFEPGEAPRDTVATGDPLLRLQRTLPLAIRFDAYATTLSKDVPGQVRADLQAPWVIKLLSGGQVAHKVSYYTYFLLTERGEVAGLEDAYLQFTDIASSGVSVILGQFQVSDPLFKRELRLTYDDYMAYRTRVGRVIADLTYDRGAVAMWSPWEGGDLTATVVTGRGLGAANDQRQFDSDPDKNYSLRYSQDIGRLRVGAFAYAGAEKQDDRYNRVNMWGPDATLSLGTKGEVNLQYLQRTDNNPFFGTCSASRPCPGGFDGSAGTTVKSGFAEVVFSPQGPAGRLFFSGLYNWIDADAPVVSLGLGEQATAPGFLDRYSAATGAVHYVYRRNIRILGEAMWDIERRQGRYILGLVAGF